MYPDILYNCSGKSSTYSAKNWVHVDADKLFDDLKSQV